MHLNWYLLGYGVVGTKKGYVYYRLDEQNTTHIIRNETEELENVYCYNGYEELVIADPYYITILRKGANTIRIDRKDKIKIKRTKEVKKKN